MPSRSRHRMLTVGAALLLLSAGGWRTYRQVRQAQLDTQLVAAADGGDAARARALLDQGADPNARPVARAPSAWQRMVDALLARRRVVGDPVLLTCARWRSWDIARDLLRHGANPNVRGHRGWTPLMWAAFEAPFDVVKLLVDHGADVRAADPTGFTALSLATVSGPRYDASPKVGLLLAHGADPRREPALTIAIVGSNGDLAGVLLAHGADPNEYDPRSNMLDGAIVAARLSPGGNGGPPGSVMTALMAAAREGHVGAVRALLRAGADPTRRVPFRNFRTGLCSSRDLAHNDAIRAMLGQAETAWRRAHPQRAALRRSADRSPGPRRASD